MMDFFKKWNFKKHFALVVSFYAVLVTAANALMLFRTCKKSEREINEGVKWLKYISPEEQKKAVAKSYVCEPSKSFKTVNSIIGMCFTIDLASYPIVKRIFNRL